jgi:ABC-type multidrug transport system fused ATPase/permease subunit
LGETKQDSGHLLVRGRVAYVPQEAWVFGATLRQNITFGAKYDQAAYQRTIKVCALNKV